MAGPWDSYGSAGSTDGGSGQSASPSAPVAAPAVANAPPGGSDAATAPWASYANPASSDPAVPHAPSVVPYMIDSAKRGMTGLLGLAGAGVSAINTGLAVADAGINAVTGAKGRHLSSEHPVGGVEQVTSGWEKLLDVKHLTAPPTAQGNPSKSNEYLGKIAEFAGASFLPGAGAVAAASQKLATAAVVALGDVSAATSSIEAKQFAGEHAHTVGLSKEQGEQIGEAVGGLLGPAGMMKVGQKFVQGLNATQSLAREANLTGGGKTAQQAAANQLLVKEINTALEHAPASPQNIARSMELAKKIPGWNPTLAQQSNAPGLIAMQKAVATKSPEALAKAAAADERNLAALAAKKENDFPTTGLSPTDPARAKLSSANIVLSAQADRTRTELRGLTDKFRSTVDNEAIGDALRAKYWEARGAAKAVTDQQLASTYAVAREHGIVSDLTDIRDSVNKIVTADRTTFQDMPPLFSKILSEYPAGKPASFTREATTPQGAVRPIFKTVNTPATAGKSEASFEELHSLYKQANKDWADATASGQLSKAHYMKLVKDQLQSKVDAFAGPQYGALAEKFKTYNADYAKFSQTFREGAGGEIAKRTRTGLSTDSEDIVNKVILQAGNKKKGVQDFFSMFGSDQDAAHLLHDGLLDNASKAAIKSGTLDPKALAGWMTKHSAALGELPELRKTLGNTQALADSLVTRQRELVVQRKVLDGTVLAKVAKAGNPELIVKQALSDTQQAPRVMKALLAGATTPEGKNAIARSVADVIGTRPDGFEYLMANEKSLRPVMDRLGAGHWENLKDLAEAQKVMNRIAAPTEIELAKLQDVGEQVIGTSVKGLMSRVLAAKQGRIGAEYAVTDIAGRWYYKARTEELDRLREAAMFDPDTAKLMATLAKKKGPPTKAELLNLQHLTFQAGAMSTSGAVGQKRDEERRGAAGAGGN